MSPESFGQVLRRLRGDLSLRELANRAKCGKSYISALEHGRGHPSAAIAAALDTALNAEGELIAAAQQAAGPSLADRAAALRGVVHVALSREGMSDAGVEDWEYTVARHGRATRYRPEADLLAELFGDFADLLQVLGHRHPPPARRRLHVSAAHMSGLMALTLLKLGDTRSRDWWRTGRAAAAAAEDQTTRSWLCAHESYALYYKGDMTGAVELAQHAQSLGAGTPCVGPVLAAPLEARAHAVLGDRDATQHALQRAEQALHRLDPAMMTSSAFGYSESQLRFHAGNAWTHLQDTRRAEEEQKRALELYSDNEHMDRTLIQLDRAVCMAHDGDTAAAAAWAAESLDALPQEHRSSLIIDRARELANSVPESRQTLPEVRALRRALIVSTGRIAED